jgi:hypothetical protein
MSANLSRRKFLAASAAVTAGSLAAPWIARADANEITALLITGGPLYPKYWEKIVQDFTAKTGIKVRYDLLEFTPLTAKVVTLSAARSSQYDVYSTHTAQIDSYFNHFAPLNTYFSDSELAEFYPVAVKYLRDPKTGNLAAIPRNMDSRVQYYRSDIYQEKGLKPAETWEELVDVGLKLTGNGHYGLVVPGQGDPAQRTFSDLLWQAGGDWVDQANKPAFNSEAGIKALTFYRDLIQKHKVVPPDAVGYQWNEFDRILLRYGLCQFRLAGRLRHLVQSGDLACCRQVVDGALHQGQGRYFLRHLPCHGAQRAIRTEGSCRRIHQIHGRPGSAAAAVRSVHQLPQQPDDRQGSDISGKRPAGHLAAAARDDDRQRQGMAEARRFLESLHADVLGHRAGAYRPGLSRRLAQPSGD